MVVYHGGYTNMHISALKNDKRKGISSVPRVPDVILKMTSCSLECALR